MSEGISAKLECHEDIRTFGKTSLSIIVRIFAKLMDQTNNIPREKLKWHESTAATTRGIFEDSCGEGIKTLLVAVGN